MKKFGLTGGWREHAVMKKFGCRPEWCKPAVMSVSAEGDRKDSSWVHEALGGWLNSVV